MTRKITTLIKKAEKDGFLLEKEGIELFGALAERATTKADDAAQKTTEAFSDLNTIRVLKLAETYGEYKSFEAFLQEWCDHNMHSRSNAWNFMKAISLWSNGLNRELEELLAIKGAVYAVRPLIEDKKSRLIAEMNPTTGEVTKLANGWQTILDEKYPEAKTPTQAIALWINDNMQVEDTGRSIRVTMRDQRESSKVGQDRFWFSRVWENGHVVDIAWNFKDSDGKQIEGKSVRSMNKDPFVIRHFCRLLGMSDPEISS